jgi:hypothetical protein
LSAGTVLKRKLPCRELRVLPEKKGGFIDTSKASSEASYLIAYVFYNVVYSLTDLLIG